MNTTKNVFDVSPFLLLESSADSESCRNGGDAAQIKGGHVDGKCIINDYGGDDIESCSASSCETSCVTWTSRRPSGSGFDPEGTVTEERVLAAGEEEDEDGEGEVNSYIRCGRSQRENLAVDSGAVVSEMDKSRMFWEACLASWSVFLVLPKREIYLTSSCLAFVFVGFLSHQMRNMSNVFVSSFCLCWFLLLMCTYRNYIYSSSMSSVRIYIDFIIKL